MNKTVCRSRHDLLLQSSKAYKIGVMFCRRGQATEEEMYGNGESVSQSINQYSFNRILAKYEANNI